MRRGEVWLVCLDPISGSEQGKTRPCVVVQRDAANRSSPTSIVVPVADAGNRPSDLLNVLLAMDEGALRKRSRALCNQVRAVDRRRFRGNRLGTVSPATMSLIENGLRLILDLDD